jgi:hypothetical protein
VVLVILDALEEFGGLPNVVSSSCSICDLFGGFTLAGFECITTTKEML